MLTPSLSPPEAIGVPPTGPCGFPASPDVVVLHGFSPEIFLNRVDTSHFIPSPGAAADAHHRAHWALHGKRTRIVASGLFSTGRPYTDMEPQIQRTLGTCLHSLAFPAFLQGQLLSVTKRSLFNAQPN